MPKTIYNEIVDPNHNFLFTTEQLNQAKIDNKCLSIRCLHCNKTFYISRRQYLRFLKGRERLKYCSQECSLATNPPQVTKPCLNCGKLVTKCASEAKKYPNFFCCQSCAASYNNKHRTRNKKHHKKIAKCKHQICKVCGQIHCQHPEICKGNWLRQQQSITRLQTMGFNISVIGSQDVYHEYDRFRSLVEELYIQKQLSMVDLAKLWNLPCSLTVTLLFRWLIIQPRSVSEQQHITKLKKPQIAVIKDPRYYYKHEWHTT